MRKWFTYIGTVLLLILLFKGCLTLIGKMEESTLKMKVKNCRSWCEKVEMKGYLHPTFWGMSCGCQPTEEKK